MATEYNVINNQVLLHFEIQLGDDIGFMEYRFNKNNIVLMHTQVPKSMEGKGVAPALAKYAFDYAREHYHPVVVYCPYVLTYLKRHPELNELLDKPGNP